MLVCLFFITGSVWSQDNYRVMNWESHLSWHKYLIQQMHDQYRQRQAEIQQAFASSSAARKYQAGIKSRYKSIAGSFPESTPLNAQTVETIQRDGYTIEKVIYESFKNHHVTAILYIPNADYPLPAALFFCGHEREAKAVVSYQKLAILLAQNGFVVLVIDPISQAERFQLTDEEGKPVTRGGTTEHTLLNVGSNLVGTNIVNYEYWDNKRGLDYLLSRSEVDTANIGVLGNSGGGTMATYFMGLNDTPKVAAPGSFVTKRERAIEVLGPQDGCQWVPYEGRERLEIIDFYMMHDLVPTILLAGTFDFVDYVGVESAFREMKKFYSTLNKPEQAKLFSWTDGHGVSRPKREAAVEWFRRWFYNDSSGVEEGDLPVLTEEELQVTKTGQVNSSFPNEYTIQQRNLDLADSLRASREKFQSTNSRSSFNKKLQQLLGIDIREQVQQVKSETRGAINRQGYSLQKVILRRASHMPVPLLMLEPPKRNASGKTIVWLHEEGKQAVASNQKQLRQYVNSGDAVIMADLRGMGETEDPAEFNDPKYYDNQYRNNILSLHIGVPVIGQRINDIETILNFISQHRDLSDADIQLYATGIAGTPTLHAAVLDDRIGHVYLINTLRSYMDLLQNPTMKNGYAHAIPNALKFYDLPDLVSLIGPEKITYKAE